ncbi:hypothetical protein FB451DRAFT_1172445 [Mycena latifolia]|nr:hypothetical protein FB451DRAFT_1172445 [Mycena latifolia]
MSVAASGMLQCGRRKSLPLIDMINALKAKGQGVYTTPKDGGNGAGYQPRTRKSRGRRESPALVEHIRAHAVVGDCRIAAQRGGGDGDGGGVKLKTNKKPVAMGRRKVGTADSGRRYLARRKESESLDISLPAEFAKCPRRNMEASRAIPSENPRPKWVRVSRRLRRSGLPIQTKMKHLPNVRFRGRNEQFLCSQTDIFCSDELLVSAGKCACMSRAQTKRTADSTAHLAAKWIQPGSSEWNLR